MLHPVSGQGALGNFLPQGGCRLVELSAGKLPLPPQSSAVEQQQPGNPIQAWSGMGRTRPGPGLQCLQSGWTFHLL